jgi:hypothetical protein
MRRESVTGRATYRDDGSVEIDFGGEIRLRPGDSLVGWELCGDEAYATVERAGLLRRWATIVRARLRGIRGPHLVQR